MCVRMWLEIQKEDGRWMSLKLLWAVLFFSFCGVLWRTVLRNPGLGKWFWKDRVDWRTLLSVGSWDLEMEYFTLITTGILKWCVTASVKIPWRQKIAITPGVISTVIISKISYVHWSNVNAIGKIYHLSLISG